MLFCCAKEAVKSHIDIEGLKGIARALRKQEEKKTKNYSMVQMHAI